MLNSAAMPDRATRTVGERVGLLLINLGTPDAPTPTEVRRYLREFLSDPRVLDMPALSRWLLLNLIILPLRPRTSAEAYAKIWTERGSPLLLQSEALLEKVRRRFGTDVEVALAMRYGRPSIPDALARFRASGIDRIVVFPLYPQYSSAATGSSIEKVFEAAAKLWNVPSIQVVPPFYDDAGYLDAWARITAPVIAQARPERVMFSFHGLPERQCRKTDDTGAHCLVRADCCERIVTANRNCYRAQCLATARAIADRLGLTQDQWLLCFQSRLGRTPWIKPYTDLEIIRLAREGVRRVVILSPAFVADCLETLEELGIRAAASFRANGGEELHLVPCLNDEEGWADTVAALARASSGWLGGGDPATRSGSIAERGESGGARGPRVEDGAEGGADRDRSGDANAMAPASETPIRRTVLVR